MISIRVLDSDLDTVCKELYDVCLFASGYESRCVHVPGLVNPSAVATPLVFGFTEEAKSESRPRNDAFFCEKWKRPPIPLSTDDERPIYEYLQKSTRSIDRPIRILLDYSSMSRLWYTAVLNWARFAASGRSVVIDFTYALGKYKEEDHPYVIRRMVSIPGCEGRAYRLRESVAVFGLGFYGMATLCVLDHLEADTVYAFLATHEGRTEYAAKTREANQELISSSKTKAVLELPLASVETSYRNLAETIAPHRPDGEITFVPMGPKPHVLASILLAMRFPEVACLRVSSTPDPTDIQAAGETVATRVIVKGE
jgi:hypothetical protein